MIEIRGAISWDDLGRQAHLLANLILESGNIGATHLLKLLQSQLMPLHVQDGRGAKFRGHETLVELACVIDFRDKGVGDDLAGLVVLGIFSENLRLESPVLIEL